MRFFFSSRKFKIILATVIAFIALSVVCVIIGGRMAPQADVFGTITAPFRNIGAKVSNGVSDFISAFKDGEKALIENAELQSEINDLREQLADYEKVSSENEFYKDYLEIKDKNPEV